MSIYHPAHHFSWPIFAVNILDLVGHVAVPPRFLGYPSLSSVRVGSVPWDLLSAAGVPLQRTALGPLELIYLQTQWAEVPGSFLLFTLTAGKRWLLSRRVYESPASLPGVGIPLRCHFHSRLLMESGWSLPSSGTHTCGPLNAWLRLFTLTCFPHLLTHLPQESLLKESLASESWSQHVLLGSQT